MKQRNFFIFTMLVVFLAALLCVNVFAASVAGSHGTDVEIGFEAGIGVVPPVNPEKPEEETGLPGTDQEGPLSLDWVPVFTFGDKHDVSPTVETYDTTATQPYIQVSDLRGTGSGWRVDASLSGFTNASGASLQGAYIELKNGEVNTATIGIAPPVPENSVKLTSNGDIAKVVTASDILDAGRGTWVVRWYPTGADKDVQLTVPAAAAAVGTHTAIITWILYDAP